MDESQIAAISSSPPVVLSRSVQMRVFGLFSLAMTLTLVGVFLGMSAAAYLLTSGLHLGFAIVELGLIFTATWWSRHTPWNYILFGAFPLFSGITITPYLLLVLAGYENGSAILLNAVAATVFMSLSAIVLARLVPNLAVVSRMLFFGLLGLLFLSLFQLFVPALQTQGVEFMIAGAGVVLFGAFTAYDIQRIAKMSTVKANPFLLALSLYLDIYNLFLYILRFMVALSGDRR